MGTTVTFDGSKSIDDVAIKSYVWTLTDVTPQTLTGMQPKYTFNNVGDFEVTLNVSDYAGNWNTDIIAITAVFACSFNVVLDDVNYPVYILSNSTVSNFNFNKTEMQISFDVTGESGTTGYCNVSIPKSLLTGNPWTIKVDDATITDFIKITNDTHTFLYFTYTHESPIQVAIEGTWVVPCMHLPLPFYQ